MFEDVASESSFGTVVDGVGSIGGVGDGDGVGDDVGCAGWRFETTSASASNARTHWALAASQTRV